VKSDDLHPEDLLARAAARALGPQEAADLQAHLQRCPACALQLDLRAEVDRALAPTDADYELGGRTVERLLASNGSKLAAVAVPRGARHGRAHLVARAALVLLMLVGTGVGAAALVYRVREGHFPGAASGERPRTPVARAARRAGAPRVEAAEPGAQEAPPVVQEAPAAVVAPPVEVPRPRPGVSRGAEAPQSRVAPAPVEPAPPVAPSVASSGATPLFQDAERVRRAGDAKGAERLYARLAAEFPDTREETVARALRGQLLLDELGRPSEALASFDAYLRAQPQGALAEETRAARAEALRRLGRRADEAAAWRELLGANPRSIHAARARDRLAALASGGD
jgi:hypothetical protein